MTTAIQQTHPITTLSKFLEARKDKIRQVMADGLDVERVTKIAIAAVSRNNRLMQCSPESIYSAIHTSVQLGLEIGGPLGEAYLVPYKNKHTGKYEAQFQPGYQGLITLARRSGNILKVYARVVYERDEFDVSLGIHEDIKHKPFLSGDPGKPVLVYAVAHVRDAEPQFEVMTVAQVEAVRARSQSKNDGPWVTDWTEMAKKTVFKRLAKWLPKSTTEAGRKLAEAIEHDNETEGIELPFTVEDSGDTPASTPAALPEPSAQVAPVATRADEEKAALRAKREEQPAEKRTRAVSRAPPPPPPANAPDDVEHEVALLAEAITDAKTSGELIGGGGVGSLIEAARKRIGEAHYAALKTQLVEKNLALTNRK